MRSSSRSPLATRGKPGSSSALQKVADYDGAVDAASFARGEKVWFREMTGIKPLTIAEVVAPDFAQAARKAYPG